MQPIPCTSRPEQGSVPACPALVTTSLCLQASLRQSVNLPTPHRTAAHATAQQRMAIIYTQAPCATPGSVAKQSHPQYDHTTTRMPHKTATCITSHLTARRSTSHHTTARTSHQSTAQHSTAQHNNSAAKHTTVRLNPLNTTTYRMYTLRASLAAHSSARHSRARKFYTKVPYNFCSHRVHWVVC